VQPSASRCHGNRISDALTCNAAAGADTPVHADGRTDGQTDTSHWYLGRAVACHCRGRDRLSARRSLVAEAEPVITEASASSSLSLLADSTYDRVDTRMSQFCHFPSYSLTLFAVTEKIEFCNTVLELTKKELGGQMSKCLKFCTGIEILNRFSLKNERL